MQRLTRVELVLEYVHIRRRGPLLQGGIFLRLPACNLAEDASREFRGFDER